MIRKATEEDIRKIKKGDLFLVDARHDGTIHQYEAAEDALFNGRRWCVAVQGFTQDARTGEFIANAARVFDDCHIVIGDLSAGRINELRDALYNLKIIAKTSEEEPGEIIGWSTLTTFLHYFNLDNLTNDMEWLKTNGYIGYKKEKKGIKELVIHKKEISYQ